MHVYKYSHPEGINLRAESTSLSKGGFTVVTYIYIFGNSLKKHKMLKQKKCVLSDELTPDKLRRALFNSVHYR
jgi:hypothetical protein